MDSITLFGVFGTGLILLAYVMNQRGHWPNTSKKYDVVNMIGSLMLVIFAITTDSLPFIILNGVWFAIAFRDVVRPFIKRKLGK